MIESDVRNTRAKVRAQSAFCSFDVFDTFLLRTCTTPEGVFERAFQLSPVSARYPGAAASYVQHRIQAEARARSSAKERRGSYEVTIIDIYSYFPFRLFQLDRTALQDLADAELQAEFDLCRVNREILHLYQEAQKSGQHVGFISDTYWNERQLTSLLRHCQPDLNWDYLYVSCENGTSKSEELFDRYLSDQGVDPTRAIHIGDNENADIKSARRRGMRTRFYPQASASFAAQLQRESAVFELLYPSDLSRLDQGLRSLRRVVIGQAPEKSAAFHLGVATLGPAMAAFDAFIRDRTAQLQTKGRNVRVAYLGRDGYLPHLIRRDHGDDTASYIEINRRVSLIASATTIEPLVELFSKITKIDARTFGEIVKILPAPVERFFSGFPNGIATGKELADALPELLNESQTVDIATAMRETLLAYLRQAIPDFDDCTDLVLVDIGYCGSIQKSLRRIFDCEGINITIHGAYLISLDDAFDDVAPDDTAEGFISDLVVTPHVNRMLTRNAMLLEQICCSPVGSVRGYQANEVLREVDPRPAEQLALVAEIQAGALAFVTGARDLSPAYRLEPFESLDIAAKWTAAILGRFLLLPTDDELVTMGTLQHDVNLGTQTLAPMLDGTLIKNLQIAQALPIACTAPAPPMWLAGSFATLSPAHGFLYMLFGANRLPADIFGDIKCGTITIGLFGVDGSATMESVACYRTGLGEIRIRVPISRKLAIKTIAVPIAQLAPEGVLHGVSLQTGKTIRKASKSIDVIGLPEQAMTMAGLDRSGRYYRAADDSGCLLISVVSSDEPVTIFSIALTPLNGDRILAMQSDNANNLAEAMVEQAPHAAAG